MLRRDTVNMIAGAGLARESMLVTTNRAEPAQSTL